MSPIPAQRCNWLPARNRTDYSMKKSFLPIIAVGLLALYQQSFAATEDFTISLDGAQDGGGGRTGSGSGTLTLDTTANTLTFNNIIWSGLSADSIASHIHGPGASGVSAGVLYPLNPTYTTVGAGIPKGTISGTLSFVAGPGGFPTPPTVHTTETSHGYIKINPDH